jgi:two-component system heavy metal sensor histidine kinase CusS
VTTPAATVRRALGAAKRSLTAQVSMTIALVSVLIILFFGVLLDSFVASELREENELLLLSSLAFIRDDAVAAGGDPAAVARVIERTSRRTHWLHAAAYDGRGDLVAKSPGILVPLDAFPPQAVDAATLSTNASVAQLEELRPAIAPATAIWVAPDGRHFRVMRGRVRLPEGDLAVTLAVETTATRELRMRSWGNVEVALWAAAALATLFGWWIARRILASVRRFGATASRIHAQELRERLPLQETPTELVESAAAFNHMLDRLQGAFDRLSGFSSELAHDLRTPIGNLLGEAQVALSRPRSAEEYRAVLESAVEEYERISRMTENMLFLARADDHAAISPHWLDLDAALERVIGYFELLAEERDVSLRMHVDAGAAPHRVWADETMLVRALSNLVSNALRHATRGTPVVLSAMVEPSGGACILRVANEGPAIPAEHLPLIFERFYRVDASRQGSASGSGLGLAIVKSIMDMHRGRVTVTSATGKPTIFSLRFPAPG